MTPSYRAPAQGAQRAARARKRGSMRGHPSRMLVWRYLTRKRRSRPRKRTCLHAFCTKRRCNGAFGFRGKVSRRGIPAPFSVKVPIGFGPSLCSCGAWGVWRNAGKAWRIRLLCGSVGSRWWKPSFWGCRFDAACSSGACGLLPCKRSRLPLPSRIGSDLPAFGSSGSIRRWRRG